MEKSLNELFVECLDYGKGLDQAVRKMSEADRKEMREKIRKEINLVKCEQSGRKCNCSRSFGNTRICLLLKDTRNMKSCPFMREVRHESN